MRADVNPSSAASGDDGPVTKSPEQASILRKSFDYCQTVTKTAGAEVVFPGARDRGEGPGEAAGDGRPAPPVAVDWRRSARLRRPAVLLLPAHRRDGAGELRRRRP